MHSAVIFGWSSISQIMKEDDFFLSEGSLAKRNSGTSQFKNIEQDNLRKNISESCFANSEEEGSQSHGSSNRCSVLFGLSESFGGSSLLCSITYVR